jgi:hypothetical protein
MADEIVALRAEKRNNVACVKWIARAFCDQYGNPRGEMPMWAHAVTDTLLLGLAPTDAAIRSLTPSPAPRVLLLNEWRIRDRNGAHPPLVAPFHDEEEARERCATEDIRWPAGAPHRVVRVALVEEAVSDAYTLRALADADAGGDDA